MEIIHIHITFVRLGVETVEADAVAPVIAPRQRIRCPEFGESMSVKAKEVWFLDVFGGSVAWNLKFARHEIEHGKQVFCCSVAPRFSLGG